MHRPTTRWFLIACLVLLPGCALIGLPGSNIRGCYSCGRAVPAPPVAEAALTRFVAMGDFGTGAKGRNREVAAALQQFLAATDGRAERVFELGDNFYYRGLVGSRVRCPDLPASREAITKQALDVLAPFEFLRSQGITLTAIPGNHDYGCGGQGLANQYDIDRWLPAEHQWGRRWEILSGLPHELILGGGAVQVIVLDSERMITDRGFRDESARVLEDLLARGRYRWRVLVAHHPLRTNGVHDGAWWKGTLPKLASFVVLPSHVFAWLQIPPFDLLNQEAYSIRYVHYRDAVEAAVARSGVPVALFLAGHDHQLQLLGPDAPGQPFVLVSGAAAKCAPVRAAHDTLFASAKNGFAVITAYAHQLEVEFIGTTDCDVRQQCAHATDGRPHRLFSYRIGAE